MVVTNEIGMHELAPHCADTHQYIWFALML